VLRIFGPSGVPKEVVVPMTIGRGIHVGSAAARNHAEA
jgi:hypothetical protein